MVPIFVFEQRSLWKFQVQMSMHQHLLHNLFSNPVVTLMYTAICPHLEWLIFKQNKKRWKEIYSLWKESLHNGGKQFDQYQKEGYNHLLPQVIEHKKCRFGLRHSYNYGVINQILELQSPPIYNRNFNGNTDTCINNEKPPHIRSTLPTWSKWVVSIWRMPST